MGAVPCLDQHPMLSPAGSPWKPRVAKTPAECHWCPQPHAAGRGCPHSQAGGDACLHLLPASYQLQEAGTCPGICQGWRWGERGFFDSCGHAKSTGETPDWPLPFPAQHGQEHELLLWHWEEGTGATWSLLPALMGPKSPQNQHSPMYMPGATKQKLFLYGFLGVRWVFGHLSPQLGCETL